MISKNHFLTLRIQIRKWDFLILKKKIKFLIDIRKTSYSLISRIYIFDFRKPFFWYQFFNELDFLISENNFWYHKFEFLIFLIFSGQELYFYIRKYLKNINTAPHITPLYLTSQLEQMNKLSWFIKIFNILGGIWHWFPNNKCIKMIFLEIKLIKIWRMMKVYFIHKNNCRQKENKRQIFIVIVNKKKYHEYIHVSLI